MFLPHYTYEDFQIITPNIALSLDFRFLVQTQLEYDVA